MPRDYANPTYDFVFKKVFGSPNHKNITMNFLNSVLRLDGQNSIVEISFDDPHIRKENRDDGFSIIDVFCTDQMDRKFLIEMQRIDERDFLERMQYYCAKGLTNQLDGTKKIYENLTPVVVVGVVNFALLKAFPGYVSNHAITCKQDNNIYLNHLSFCLVELAKFNKKEHELADDIDRWIFFMNNAEGFIDKPTVVADKNDAIIDAFSIVDKANWSIRDLRVYEKDVDQQRVRDSEFATALEKGIEAIARNFLSEGIDEATIAKATGLSPEIIKNLKNG